MCIQINKYLVQVKSRYIVYQIDFLGFFFFFFTQFILIDGSLSPVPT